jgi:hypothetical protein
VMDARSLTSRSIDVFANKVIVFSWRLAAIIGMIGIELHSDGVRFIFSMIGSGQEES